MSIDKKTTDKNKKTVVKNIGESLAPERLHELIKEEKEKRAKAFLEAVQKAEKEFNCSLVPCGQFVGNQIQVEFKVNAK